MAVYPLKRTLGLTVQHRELCSLLCGSRDGRGVWGRLDTCYMCGWVPFLSIWNYHNMVNLPCSNIKEKVKKKKTRNDGKRTRGNRKNTWNKEEDLRDAFKRLLINGVTLARMGASLVAQWLKNPPEMQETRVLLLGWEDLLEEGMETLSSILAWTIP